MELRHYQKEAIKKTYSYLKYKKGNAPIIEVFTGGGKSLIMAKIILDMLRIGRRVLSVTHVRELIEQNYIEFKKLCPDAQATIYSAGLSKKDSSGDVVFAGVQSFYDKSSKKFDLIIIDECDLVSTNDKTQYKTMINKILAKNKDCKIIGLTATPYRMDSGYIYKGEDTIFDGISYQVGYKELLEMGYLCPIVTKQSKKRIDTDQIQKRGGEYIASQLSAVASKDELVESSVAEIVEAGVGRKKWLIFSSGVKHSELLQDEFKKHNIHALTVNGKTPKPQRDSINNQFKKSERSVLISCGTHTTGFNAPDIDLIAIVRATMSTRLMVQMIGRGVRIHPSKENLLLLDFGNNILTHGFLDDLRINEKTRKTGEKEIDARVKECPMCKGLYKMHIIECPDCGYIYELEAKVHHEKEAYSGAVTKEEHESQVYEDKVISQSFFLHQKQGKAPILKCMYMIGLDYIYDWICLRDDLKDCAHLQKKFALDFGAKKVVEHGGSAETLSNALSECEKWNMPEYIQWKYKGKYKKIIKKFFKK